MAIVKTAVTLGITPLAVIVEATVEDGARAGNARGLVIEGVAPNGAVCEMGVRVRSALDNIGWSTLHPTPGKVTRVQVRFGHGTPDGHAPEQVPGDAALDLPIAWAVAQAWGVVPETSIFCFGELALDGRLRPVRGACVRMRALAQFDLLPDRVFVPRENADEASTVYDGVLGADHVGALTFEGPHPRFAKHFPSSVQPDHDFRDCRLRPETFRAITVALATGGSILLWGSPGAGKTMIARRLGTTLPEMNPREVREYLEIMSVSGLINPQNRGLQTISRPFRAPHHSVSDAALIGGGLAGRPGELPLAHNGVLFFDELPEFRRGVPDAVGRVLRSPEGTVRLAVRGAREIEYPARPAIVVGSANPCPCGYNGHPRMSCVCPETAINRYRARIRDAARNIKARTVVHVPSVGPADKDVVQVSSAEIRGWAEAARERLPHVAPVEGEVSYLVRETARVCAALDGVAVVQPEHMAEAQGYVEPLLL